MAEGSINRAWKMNVGPGIKGDLTSDCKRRRATATVVTTGLMTAILHIVVRTPFGFAMVVGGCVG